MLMSLPVFRVQELTEVEAFHLGREGRGKRLCIEDGGLGDAGFAREQALPDGVDLETQRCNPANAGNNDAATHVGSLCEVQKCKAPPRSRQRVPRPPGTWRRPLRRAKWRKCSTNPRLTRSR